ncbi:Sensor protein kdpD [Mycobacteroides abscessus subsp. abscessus]|nr:Sensor protein kdpD [Mycobacteroides abscessus subsp. abscessus]
MFVAPRYSFTIGETDNALTILMMMVTAVAVAALVDAAATRARQARRASREAELLALFGGRFGIPGGRWRVCVGAQRATGAVE